MSEKTSNYTKEQKEKMINQEMAKLKKIFKNVGKEKLDTCASLIKNASFMTVTLLDLQETINQDGAVSTYQNGENQWGTKKSPEVDIYNTMIKNYQAIIKQLMELLPKVHDAVGSDGFDDFINSRTDV